MRKLSRASAQAGTGASPQTVAMHYAAPELAKYFTGVDASFLQELTHKAQPIADQLVPPVALPTVLECSVAEKAYKKLKKLESIWGTIGVITMSIVCGIWFSHSLEGMAWLGYLLPFLGPGMIAYKRIDFGYRTVHGNRR